MFKLKKKKLIYFFLLGISLLLLSSFIPLLRPFTFDILKYPLRLFTALGREFEGIIFYHRNFTQGEALRKEIGILKTKLNLAADLYLENKRLKRLLDFKQRAPYKVIAARVIGRAADNWSSIVIIDKGRLAGIKNGFVVISYSGLAGRIIETAQLTSKVMLIDDSSLSVSGLVQRSRQEGLITGTLGTTLMMRYLPKDADIKISDAIETSGLTQIYPKGLLIGTVIDVGEEFSGLSRYAVIKPAVNLSSIEEVLIIIP